MKKILLFFASILATSSMLVAQDNCMQFFPNNPGTVLISKTFDAQNNLLSTMTYHVNKVSDYASGSNTEIAFALSDMNGKTIDSGNLEAYCNDGNFYMKMMNRSMTPEVMKSFTTNTEIVGDFLDYPDVNDEVYLSEDGPFKMEDGKFTIHSKSDKKDQATVRVYNRQYIKNEDITTPAMENPFHAAKVTFNFEVTKDNMTTQYKGVEWYAANAGIVKAETFDNNNNLLTTTLLTTLQGK